MLNVRHNIIKHLRTYNYSLSTNLITKNLLLGGNYRWQFCGVLILIFMMKYTAQVERVSLTKP